MVRGNSIGIMGEGGGAGVIGGRVVEGRSIHMGGGSSIGGTVAI